MPTRQYFRWVLWLPMVLAAAGLFLRSTKELAVFVLLTAPIYAPIAIGTARRIRRTTRMSQVVLLTLIVPLIFSALLTAIAAMFGGMFAYAFGYTAALFALCGSYAFVAVAWILYFALRATKLVVHDFAA